MSLSPTKKILPVDTVREVQPSPADAQKFRQQMGHISRQSAVFFVGTIFTAVAGYLFKVYLARVLGAEALGIYALGMTVVGLVGIVAAVGLPQSASRFVAAYAGTEQLENLRGFLWRSFSMLVLLNVVAGLALMMVRRWIAASFYHTPELAAYMQFFVAIMFVGAMTGFLGQVLAGYKDVAQRTVITNFVGTPLTMALSVALLTLGFGLKGYLVAQLASALFVLVLLARATWRLTPPQARWSLLPLPGLEAEVISFSAVLFAVQGLEFLLSQTDRVVLGIYLDARQVGIYALAATIVGFVAIILQSVNQIFSPTIAELHARGERELLARLYQALTKWSLGLTIPLAFVVMLFARPLMEIFGPDFASGWPVLVIGAAGQLVNCGVGSVGILLLMSGQQSRLIRVQAFVAPVTIALTIMLIPVWGLVGAATASAVANVLINLLCLREVRKTLDVVPSGRSYYSLVLPAVATLASTFSLRIALKSFHPQWLVIVIASVLAYVIFVAVAIAAGLEPDDKLIAQSAWDRIRRIRERTV